MNLCPNILNFDQNLTLDYVALRAMKAELWNHFGNGTCFFFLLIDMRVFICRMPIFISCCLSVPLLLFFKSCVLVDMQQFVGFLRSKGLMNKFELTCQSFHPILIVALIMSIVV